LKITALSHSKHRNAFGLIGIEVDVEKKIIHVRLAKQWRREEINQIPSDIAQAFSQIKWDSQYMDQKIGEHLIKAIKIKAEFTIKVITTQKNLKDPEGIEDIKILDIIEMTQFLLQLKINHQIQLPENPGKTMRILESQIALFTEHKTEAGGIDYYAPGDEMDNLIRALMICCFAVRNILQGEFSIPIAGPVQKKHPRTLADYTLQLNKRGLSAFDV